MTTTTNSIVITTISWLHIISHTVLFLVDYTQFTKTLDVLTRSDGTRSDPHNLLPIEVAFGMLAGTSFSIIAVAYLLAIFFKVGTIQSASVLSVWFHVLYMIHIIWKWDVWHGVFHPDGSLSPELLFGTHVLWTVLALIAIYLGGNTTSKVKNVTTKDK